MKNFTLSQKEIDELRIAHKYAKKNKLVKEAYRINAIVLLGTGWTAEEVSEALLLDKNTIGKYVDIYRNRGLNGLLESLYKGRECKLSAKQLEELKKHLSIYTYSDAKEIKKYIKDTYDVKYSVRGTVNLLKRLGFTYKKPKRTPISANYTEQIKYLQKYEEMRRSGAEMYYMDGCHPHYNSRPDYGWVLKGHEKALLTNSGKKKVNIHGAVNIETKEIIGEVTEENFNRETALKFIKKVHEKHRANEKVCIIVDNAGYYKAQLIREYEKKHKNLEILYLPPYCPHLNLIERVWKYFYKQVVSNRYYENFTEFIKGCKKFFQRSHKQKFRTLLTENFHFGSDKITILTPSFQLR